MNPSLEIRTEFRTTGIKMKYLLEKKLEEKAELSLGFLFNYRPIFIYLYLLHYLLL